jgi:twitching motility protein PilT
VPAIDQFLTQVLERNGSDLHFLAGDPARVRQYGELKNLSDQPLTAEMVKTTLYEIMPKLAVERFLPAPKPPKNSSCRRR